MKKLFFLSVSILLWVNAIAQQNTVIEGSIKNAKNSNISLTLYKYINITEETDLNTTTKNGKFKFNFDIKEPAYVNLSSGNKALNFLFIEPGDSIHVAMDTAKNGIINFTGKGAGKFTYQYLASKQYGQWFNPPKALSSNTNNSYFNYIDSCKNVQLKFLDGFKSQLSATAYQVLSTDIIYDCEWHKTRYILNRIFSGKSDDANKLYYDLLAKKKKFILNDTMAYSRNLITYLQQQNEVDYNKLNNINGGKFSFEGKYYLAKALTNGQVQQRLLAIILLFQLNFKLDNEVLKCENDYLTLGNDSVFTTTVRDKYEFQKKFGPGSPAISFALPDNQNKTVRLQDYKGKIILLDFWFDGCEGCASVFGAMKNVKEHFKDNKDIVFINISVDDAKSQWFDGIKQYGLSEDVNLYTDNQGDKHPVVKAYGINGYPSQFLIDRQQRYISGNPPRADEDNGKALIELIEHSLASK